MKANTIKRKLCDKVIRYHIICISVHYQVQLGSSIKYFTQFLGCVSQILFLHSNSQKRV